MSTVESSPTSANDRTTTNGNSQHAGFLKYMIVGMIVTVLLLGGMILFEKSSFGHRAEMWAFEFLQRRLTPFDPKKDMPVVIVDIGQQPGGSSSQATSREYLRSLIDVLVERGPNAIAIDEDFSPNETGWASDDDPEFFEFCLKTKRERGVPIFLGVHEARDEDSDTWLGSPKYKEMAVALMGPREDTSRMPLWVQYPGVSEKLPSLSAALAKEYLKSAPKAKWHWPEWAVHITSDGFPGRQRHVVGNRVEYDIAETLVNYSKLELIQKLTLPTVNSDFIANSGDMFTSKMVIIGAVTDATDASGVPGRDNATFAGVLLHASAAYTLAKEPLYEFTTAVRWILDLVISAFVLLCVASLNAFYIKKDKKFSLEKWQARFIYLTVILVIGAGVALVRWGGVMWLDFILVIAALLMHPRIEHASKLLWKKVKAVTPGTAIAQQEK